MQNIHCHNESAVGTDYLSHTAIKTSTYFCLIFHRTGVNSNIYLTQQTSLVKQNTIIRKCLSDTALIHGQVQRRLIKCCIS